MKQRRMETRLLQVMARMEKCHGHVLHRRTKGPGQTWLVPESIPRCPVCEGES